MVQYQETVWCDGCGVEINWSPVIYHNRKYCCEDCLKGFVCRCGERIEFDEERRTSPAQPAWSD